MTYRSRSRNLLLLAAIMAAVVSVSVLASGAGTEPVRLTAVESSVEGRAGILTLQASDAISYVSSQPDPRTFVVELRDVEARGYSNQFAPDPDSPLSAVDVTSSHAVDGSVVTRVRISLSRAMRPRVRSAHNALIVEAGLTDDAPAASASLSQPSGLATTLQDMQVSRRGNSTAIAFVGNGRLMPRGIEDTKDAPPRVYIDFPGVSAELPAVTQVHQEPVERIRVGVNRRSPLVTRVVMDLTRGATYRTEQTSDGRSLTVVFEEARPRPQALAVAPDSPVPVAVTPQTAVPFSPNPGVAVSLEPSMALALAAAPAPVTPASPLPMVAAAQVAQAPVATVAAQAPRAQVAAAQAAGAPPAPAPAVVPAPVPAQVPQGAPADPTAPSRFTGAPVSLDFQAADLRAVLRTFAEISGLNIVIDPSIQGTVDVALRDVPWDQALDIILRANRLAWTQEDSIIRVVPVTVLRQEEADRNALLLEQQKNREKATRIYPLSYASGDQIADLLRSANAISQFGQTQTDSRTNTLIVTDLPEQLDKVAELIAKLDQPQPQVEIEARIVQTTRDFARTLGVKWGFNGTASSALGNSLPLAFPNQASVTGGAAGTGGAGTVVNLPVGAATSAVGLALGSVNGAFNLDVALSALERQGQGRLLSTPRVSTQNNVEAEITQGVQIPIQTVANNTVTVTFKDAALTLKVTPQITAADTVIMRISVENASPDYSRAVGASQIPPIDTQRAVTQVLVSNGDTTVIGGIYVSQEQVSQDRTPGLYRLPLLGWLFKRDGVTDQSRELLIFITPRIIRL